MSAMLPEAALWSGLVLFGAAIVHEDPVLLANTQKRQGENDFYSVMDGGMRNAEGQIRKRAIAKTTPKTTRPPARGE